jgi:hypothetical protein
MLCMRFDRISSGRTYGGTYNIKLALSSELFISYKKCTKLTLARR